MSEPAAVPATLAGVFGHFVERALGDGLLPGRVGGSIVSPSAGAVCLDHPDSAPLEPRSAYLRSGHTGTAGGPLSFERFDGNDALNVALWSRESLLRPYSSNESLARVVSGALPPTTGWFLAFEKVPDDRSWLAPFPESERPAIEAALDSAKSMNLMLQTKLFLGFDGDGSFVGAAGAERNWSASSYGGSDWRLSGS